MERVGLIGARGNPPPAVQCSQFLLEIPGERVTLSIGRALSNAACQLMVCEYVIQDLLIPRFDKVMEGFGIRKGFAVVDFGCGPGRYVRKASALVGPKGRVFAADVAYALDMFHAVRDPAAFLKEIRRIVKPGGRLILEDGHQSRASTIAKVSACSAMWKIMGETRLAVICEPVSGRVGASHSSGRTRAKRPR